MANPNPFEPMALLVREFNHVQEKNKALLGLLQEVVDLVQEEWGADDKWVLAVREELKALRPRTPKANDLDAPPANC